MIPTEVIKTKRSGKSLSTAEISFFIENYTRDQIPDYQMASLLMAIFLNGMNELETIDLTQSMLDSGDRVHFDASLNPVDKHSTGGVGDKTSLILAPIVAACGVPVPMMSGRGLGHTGGTLDKLESIPGFQVHLGLLEFRKMVEKNLLSFVGQTENICPADKKIYALRDVTATVESLPLICASIMSKKIAEGIRGLVLDVKTGSGAFMKTLEDSKALAQGLISIAKGHNIEAKALITDMNQPLGRFVGNSLEVHECLSILKTQPIESYSDFRYEDTRLLSLELASEMIAMGLRIPLQEAKTKAEKALSSGVAFEKFALTCQLQGGNVDKLPSLGPSEVVTSTQEGWLTSLDTEQIGLAGIEINAGRKKASDSIDPNSGFFIHKKIGDFVATGDPLFSIFPGMAKTHEREAARVRLQRCFSIGEESVHAPELIHHIC